MPREILFRGFHEAKNGKTTIYVDGRAVKGEWVEGWLATITPRISHINVFKSDSGNGIIVITCPVLTSTVGQFTGLDDKNGRKVFEGDIVQRKCYSYKLGRKEPTGERLLVGDVLWSRSIQEAGSWIVIGDDEFGNREEYILLPDVKVTGTIWDKEATRHEREDDTNQR